MENEEKIFWRLQASEMCNDLAKIQAHTAGRNFELGHLDKASEGLNEAIQTKIKGESFKHSANLIINSGKKFLPPVS